MRRVLRIDCQPARRDSREEPAPRTACRVCSCPPGSRNPPDAAPGDRSATTTPPTSASSPQEATRSATSHASNERRSLQLVAMTVGGLAPLAGLFEKLHRHSAPGLNITY